MDGLSVGERLAQLNQRIRTACANARRPPDSVRLVAVSKFHELPRLRAARAAGQLDFAENYAREAVTKIEAWGPDAHVRWHFIGRLQSNKVGAVTNRFDLIHAVDRLDIALRLDRATTSRQDILVQYNVAGEASKGGVQGESDLNRLTGEIIARCPKLRVRGVMVMPPLEDDPENTRPHFRAARGAIERLRLHFGDHIALHPLDHLSMGTSQDFAVAIEEGATLVRIGTDVFGPRPAAKKD